MFASEKHFGKVYETSSERNMEELSSISLMFQGNDNMEERANKIVRNRLNLEQRIEVLKHYSKTQDITQLAATFQCGRRQIKNILRKRKKYLTMWSRNKHRYDDTTGSITSSLSALSDSVDFVLREWLERARSYQINITDEILLSFGQQIAESINFKEFKPTKEWLMSFKEKFKLTDLDLNIKQEKMANPQDRKPLSVSIIIADLRRQCGATAIPMGDCKDIMLMDDDDITHAIEKSTNVPKISSSDSNDSAVCMRDDFNHSSNSGVEFAKEVENYKEALNQLGPLEQFALLKENIRAVGLINQLENLFREEMMKEEISF